MNKSTDYVSWSKHIDFCQFTLRDVIIPESEGFEIDEKMPAIIGQYQTTLKLNNGGYVHIPSKEHFARQGVLYQFAGKACGRVRDKHGDDYLINFAAPIARGCGRLDFCVNIHGMEGLMSAIRFFIRWNKYNCAARYKQGIDKIEDAAETIYLGKLDSDASVTMYNKMIEMDTDEFWTRLEFKTRRKRSKNMLADMWEHGIEKGGSSHMLNFIDFPDWGLYQTIMKNDGTADIQKTSRTEGKYHSWLRMVERSIESKVENGEEHEAVMWFLNTLSDKYTRSRDENGVFEWHKVE